MTCTLRSLIWTLEPGGEDLESTLASDGVDVLGVHRAADMPNGEYGGPPDVVVLVQNGATRRAATIRTLRSQMPLTRVVVVVGTGKGHEVRSTLEAGASGLVFRDEELSLTGSAKVKPSELRGMAIRRLDAASGGLETGSR